MFAHLKSTSVPDTEFALKWKDLQIILLRTESFVTCTSKGYSANYMNEIAIIEKSEFGFRDMEKCKFYLEGMMHLLKNEDIPKISINGHDHVLCGEIAFFEAKVERSSNFTNWHIIWQRMRKNSTENIDTNIEKYEGSTSRQLVIKRVSMEDKGEYKAIIKWERDGQTHHTTSNSIFLKTLGERPSLKKLNVTTGAEGISLHYHYEVSPGSPKVQLIRWTKNDEALNIDQKKFVGGYLMDSYLTISSPTGEDRGTYTCIVANAVGGISESLALDLPNATISTETSVCFGNETRIDSKITSCPGCEGVVWQKSSDSLTFTVIDVGEPKYYGSKLDPHNPVLILTKATFHDKLYYRLLAWNKIGECLSNTVSINVTGGTPNISSSHETNIKDRTVTLKCEIFLYENSPSLKEILWTKNDDVIDIAGSRGKYTGGNIRDASLVINDVNKYDAGSYQCKASNAVGSTAGCRIILDVPEIHVKREEKKENDTLVFTAILTSIPAVIHVQWSKKNKEDDKFVPIDITREEYIGTSNSFPNPVLVIKQNIHKEAHCFQIEAWNFIGPSAKRLPDYSSFPKDSIVDTKADPLTAIINKKGSSIRFNNLRLDLINEIPDRELNSLKASLKVMSSMELSAGNVTTVEDFFTFLVDEGIFKERNVIMMQYLLRSIKRPDLEFKCVEYAVKDKQAMCYFEEAKLPGTGYKHVQLHVVDDIEQFTDIDALLATVAGIIRCDQSCIKLVGLQPEKSFIVVILMKDEFAKTLGEKGPHGLTRLLKYKVDWIKIENKVIYIARGSFEDPGWYVMALGDRVKTAGGSMKKESIEEKISGSIKDSCEYEMELEDSEMELEDSEKMEGRSMEKEGTVEKLSDLSPSNHLSPTAAITSSISIPEVDSVNHISCEASGQLWVSDDKHLLQVDSSGHEIRKNRIEIDIFSPGGSHAITKDGELLYLDDQSLQMMTSNITRKIPIHTLRKKLLCIHSSRINGDMLLGCENEVRRYDWRGRRIKGIITYWSAMEDWEHQIFYPRYITENKNGDIWASDWDQKAVVVVDKSGEHRFNYEGKQFQSPFQPLGICTDILGQVLVCDDTYNPKVHLLDQDGQLLCLLLVGEHGVRRPRALCVDDKHNLYLGQTNSNIITVYKYLQESENKSSFLAESK